MQGKTTFGWLPALALDVRSPGHMLLNSMQDLQNYGLYKCLSPSSSLKLMLENDYSFWILFEALLIISKVYVSGCYLTRFDFG